MLRALIGDLHFGEKGNSEKYNRQLLGLLDFVVKESKQRGVTEVVQFGDWFDNRSKVDVQTLNFGINGAKILQENFDKAYTMVSNHDIYFRDRLDVTSLAVLRPYITVVDEPTMISDKTVLIPWVVSGEQWDEIIKFTHDNDVKYLFGHLELNGFLVNDMYKMEHGYSPKELRHLEHVYSGHYHSPQNQDNITYLGTPIPITMNEANESHGIYFFDDETGDVEFVEYNGVQVVSIPYTEIEDWLDADPENTTVRVEFPDDLDDETLITEIKETLSSKGFEHKIKYTDTKTQQIMEADIDSVEEVENIDAVVVEHIRESTPIEGIDKDMLSSLYELAVEKGEQADA